MLIHPFFKALVSQPELVAEHAGAYAALASAEVGEVVTQWRLRILLQLLAAGLAVTGVGLGGVALMWLGAQGAAAMPAPWVLAAVPGACLGGAAVLAWWQSTLNTKADLASLRTQWALDRQLWQEAAR